MSDDPTSPQDPASLAPDEAPDPAVLRAERRLRLLAELTEIGMELARALRPGAPDEPADATPDATPAKRRDPAEVFDRLSRAIRLTVALETRTDEALRDLKAGIAQARAEERAQAAEEAEEDADEGRRISRERVRESVVHAIYAEVDCRDRDRACNSLDEILEEDETYFDCGARPLREVVESLCKDLHLDLDWSRWNGEGWTDQFTADGHKLSLHSMAISDRVRRAEPPPPPAPPPPPGMRYPPNLE
jgi:hypothetical protein